MVLDGGRVIGSSVIMLGGTVGWAVGRFTDVVVAGARGEWRSMSRERGVVEVLFRAVAVVVLSKAVEVEELVEVEVSFRIVGWVGTRVRAKGVR